MKDWLSGFLIRVAVQHERRADGILSFVTLGEKTTGYSALKHETSPVRAGARCGVDPRGWSMAHPSRVKRKTLSGVPHLPFQEFTASSLEALLKLLKRARIKDSEIEVSTSDEGQHTTCSKPLIHVMVMRARGEGEGQYKDLAALYQYCPGCGSAVRVL